MKRLLGILLLGGIAACQDSNTVAEPESLPAGVLAFSNEGNGPDIIPGRFIVTLRDDADPAAFTRDHGVKPDFVYTEALNGFAGDISEAARAGLMRDARFLRIENDAEATISDTQQYPAWGLDRIDQRALPMNASYQYNQTGAGVTAYIVDTGIRYTHSEFQGRARPGYDALGGDASDCHGHGTHVAGTVGGAKYGVAKSVSLVGVRVLGCTGSGSWSGIIAGLDWVLATHTGPSVVNMSLGGGASDAVDAAVARLTDAGITVVVAAGNSNKDACTVSPARAPSALTIGATGSNDARASFSNFGTCIDWFAPGVNVTSSYYSSDVATMTMSGTSMASPHTAGAIALFLQVYPTASAQMARDSLYAYTSKGVVTLASSDNNHMLYSLGVDASLTPPEPPPADEPPPVDEPPPPAPPAIALTVSGQRVKSQRTAQLTWSGAAGSNVDVFRNDTKITTTANDGAHTDSFKGGSAVYRVCESGTVVCSADVTVQF